MSVLRGVLIGDDLKFLYGIFRNQSHRATHDVVIKVAPIDRDAGTSCRSTTRHDAAVQPLGGVVGRRGRGSRNQIRQLLEVAVIDGQIRNLNL